MPDLSINISRSLLDALDEESRNSGDSRSDIVARALDDALAVSHATLFQVNAAMALVAGVTRGSVTVGELLTHGDFGLGTFDDLDGELVVVDGIPHQVTKDGTSRADPAARVPYGVVLHFRPDTTVNLPDSTSFADFLDTLNELRNTDNDFFAVRIDGTFDEVRTRAVCKDDHVNLVDAAQAQAYFDFAGASGTIAGVWAPRFTQSVTVPDWHLHFLTDDEKGGGHVLNCSGRGLRAQVQRVADFHVAFPETVAFMKADLGADRRQELDSAETDG